MLQIKKLTLKESFVKNAIIMMSGTGLSQVIPLVFSPLLTRMFSPDDFGKLAIFMAFCSILTIMSTGFYELSILRPLKDILAYNILILIIILSFVTSIVIIIVTLTYHYFFDLLSSPSLSLEYLLFLPIGVFFTGMFQGLNYWLIRKKQFKIINFSKITQSLSMVLSSISLGYFGFTEFGLLIGFIIGVIFSVIPLFFIVIKRRSLISRNFIISVAKIYIDYPKLLMPTSIMNISASQAPIFFITKYFSSVFVGGYSFASRILVAPVGIVSVAIGQIYFKNISEIANSNSQNIRPVFIKTALILSLVSFILFTPFFLFGEDIFQIFFGDAWIVAGTYVEIISIAVFVKFIVSPLSTIFMATNNLRFVATWQITYFCTTILLFSISTKFDFHNLLWAYVIHEVVLYAIYFMLMIIVVKRFNKN